MGFTPNDALIIRTLYFFVPPPTDLIRMAVRDVFSPEIAGGFGLFDEFPEAFKQFAAQQGISEEWAKNYWAAHWALPSAQQGFAMFQRRIINNDELNILLKALDLVPFWRDKMRDLAFNPLTRVDTRRMYETGVLSREEVFESYLDQGYSPRNAERLTKFTETYSVPDEESTTVETRALTRSVIERAYARNIIKRGEALNQLVQLRYSRQASELLLQIVDYDNADRVTQAERERIVQQSIVLIQRAYRDRALGRNEAENQLEELGFTQQEAGLMLQLEDYRISSERKEALTKEVRAAFITNTIDKNDSIEMLQRNDFTASEALEIVEFWGFIKQFRNRKPTYTQLKRLFQSGIIRIEDWFIELRGMGYTDKSIRWLTELEFGVKVQ